MKKIDPEILIFIASLAVLFSAVFLVPDPSGATDDGEIAFSYLKQQLSFGPRTPGSAAHQEFIDWASAELEDSGWDVSLQQGLYEDKEITNVVAQRSNGKDDPNTEWILLGAHYDSRINADSDPVIANRNLPVPGANDGASGVAVLMALAKTLPQDLDKDIWLVLFDAEDQGRIPEWDNWCIGSTMMAQYLEKQEQKPDSVVIVDMVGDKDLQIYREMNSDDALMDEIWSVAADLGLSDTFINEPKYAIYDDHVPFLQIGIPAVDLIDFDYPAWHTLDDEIQNVSAESLNSVHDVLFAWLTK